MKDFTKWAAMWDAYNRMGEAVSGSPASICQGIGVTLMMVFGFVGLIAVAVIGGMGGDPEKSPFFRLTTAIAVIGGALALASFVMPSHNDAHVSEPPRALHANRENVGAGRNGRLQKLKPRAYRQPKPAQVEP
mgnify:CR=1 FL=1